MKLGIRLSVYLVGAVICTMIVFGYLSIQQDRRNLLMEIRLGMGGFSRSVQGALKDTYGNHRNLAATQQFIDKIGGRRNIHGLIVYDISGQAVAVSLSLKDPKDLASPTPSPLFKIDPKPVLLEGKGLDGYIRKAGQFIYYRVEPIFNSENKLVGAFLLGRQGSRLARTIDIRHNRILVTTFSLALVLCFIILVVIRRNVSGPIAELINRIREIGKGHWEQRIHFSGSDEIGSLAQEFNLMSEKLQDTHGRLITEQEERLKLEKNLRHSEKLASVGQLAAGLAHEIGTPLNIIGGRAEHLLRRQRTAEEINENLQIIRSQIDRIAGIVRQLLEFSRRKEPNFRTVDISSLLNNVKRLFQHKIDEKGVAVDLAAPEHLPRIQADPDLLQRVFINLYQNSLQAMGPGGTIMIRAEVTEDGDAPSGQAAKRPWLRISFEDDGRGIPPEDIDRVFEPFFTTKDVGEGTGLGLALAYGIIKEHRGEIRVESQPGHFTRFVIELPVSSREGEKNNGGAP